MTSDTSYNVDWYPWGDSWSNDWISSPHRSFDVYIPIEAREDRDDVDCMKAMAWHITQFYRPDVKYIPNDAVSMDKTSPDRFFIRANPGVSKTRVMIVEPSEAFLRDVCFYIESSTNLEVVILTSHAVLPSVIGSIETVPKILPALPLLKSFGKSSKKPPVMFQFLFTAALHFEIYQYEELGGVQFAFLYSMGFEGLSATQRRQLVFQKLQPRDGEGNWIHDADATDTAIMERGRIFFEKSQDALVATMVRTMAETKPRVMFNMTETLHDVFNEHEDYVRFVKPLPGRLKFTIVKGNQFMRDIQDRAFAIYDAQFPYVNSPAIPDVFLFQTADRTWGDTLYIVKTTRGGENVLKESFGVSSGAEAFRDVLGFRKHPDLSDAFYATVEPNAPDFRLRRTYDSDFGEADPSSNFAL